MTEPGRCTFKYRGENGFEAWGVHFPSGLTIIEWIPESVPEENEQLENYHQSVYHSWSDFRKICTGEVDMSVDL